MISATNLVMNRHSSANITDVAGLERAFSLDMNTDYPNQDSKHCHATNEVIISTGTFGTAQLLKLDGVGPKTSWRNLIFPLSLICQGLELILQLTTKSAL
jgi:hypothetical protein